MAAAAEGPARGDPAARLPEGPLAGDTWELVAGFESGHRLLVTATLTRLGLGSRSAVVAGLLVDPDGASHPFSRSEIAGGFQLSEDRRRLDLRSIVLDLSASPRRFVVDKDELRLDLALEPAGPARAVPDAAPGCRLDLVELAAPARGSLWREGEGTEVRLRGHATLTHRWSEGLETDCTRRSLELFAAGGGLDLYLREHEDGEGAIARWLLARAGGRVVFAGEATAAELAWGPPARAGVAEPVALRFEAPGLRGRAAFGPALGTLAPLDRVPAPLRVLLGIRARPWLSWSSPRVELHWSAGAASRTWRGEALAKVLYTNALPGPAAARASEGTAAASRLPEASRDGEGGS